MILSEIINLFLHLDKFLFSVVETYGNYFYLLLFLIVVIEMGIIFMPFLPGDTILFSVGALAGIGHLNLLVLFLILIVAAVLGDALNYFIGENFGRYILKKNWIKKKRVDQSHKLYEKHGGKIIVFARFIPIVRTFAPFVAGISKMRYRDFFLYNVFGAVLWTFIFLILGFFLGETDFVKNNFSLIILMIVLVSSLVPLIFEYVNRKSE